MSVIKINKQLKRVEIKEFEIENEIVFNFFNSTSASERDGKLLQAVYIGVLALMEDRFSSFLSKTTNELGTELESLKMIFEMKKEIFYRSTIKGVLAENDIAEFLIKYFEDKKIPDKVYLTGNTIGRLPRNKTGDIVCELNGQDEFKIVLECKFDKSIKLGDIDSKEIFTRKTDTAWSQLIEAQANREAQASIIVLDISLTDNSILQKYENVGYIPDIGFVAIVNSQKGDYSNLSIAYMLARDIVLNAKTIDFDKNILLMLVNRTIKDINEILSIRSLINNNIENNKVILKQLEKSILLMEFNQEYLKKFLKSGMLTKEDLLAFYQGESLKDKYKLIETNIENEILLNE
ncbi:hypothetical protein TFKS16_0636 [Tannerella forsythia KS16]|jgi:hypothetical protein|uniref:Uncharacterized protein n=1 Tax=Porphyromonas gingivalis (strain ATCC 33277 / DSM 20709 / CIP 103683 / JCM 12257 / NCTC 11834 / 2561) TaxID=431947 RepID=B2RJA4_PORG3|nr:MULTISPECIES: hypothetical protein [Bacteroidales]ALJ25362.1 hypothetical protein PGF_00009140 [Porphyromonas gingivalis 381]AUR49718.1 exonuclease sbcC [Porphyromonas gingivalis ATCC 33277]MDR4976638.1 hypothetical protein [Porphyromonas gingivalis]PDP72583.1 hypothetical protein CLI81_08725 [Porphyromonas gingivalis]SCQ19299.1 hypothetical protein TFUB22_00578 [Tannerella forsythia]